MTIKSIVKFALMLPAAGILYCGQNPAYQADNGGTDTGNPVISGKLLDCNGMPAVGAVVSMVPADYVPSLALLKTASVTVTCTTDSKGEYRIYSIDSQYYNFEARRDTCGVFCDSIRVVLDDQEHHFDDIQLHCVGSVCGVTKMPGQSDTNQVRVTLYMPGTRRITKPVIGGAFMFDQVPAGSYQLIIDPTFDTYNVKVLDFTLSAGQNLDLDTIVLDVYEPDTIVIDQQYVAGVWGPGKTYKVVNTCWVVEGQTLTILPGTTVKLFGNILSIFPGSELIIQGKLDSLITIEFGYPSGIGPNVNFGSIIVDSMMTYTPIEWVIFKRIEGLYVNNSKALSIAHCIFSDCRDAIQFNYGPSTINVTNCIFLNNANAVTRAGNISFVNSVFINNDTCALGSPPASFDYCLFFNNGIIPADTMNALLSDPLFVSLDTLNPDFHLQPGSPCLGTGLGGADIGLYD